MPIILQYLLIYPLSFGDGSGVRQSIITYEKIWI